MDAINKFVEEFCDFANGTIEEWAHSESIVHICDGCCKNDLECVWKAVRLFWKLVIGVFLPIPVAAKWRGMSEVLANMLLGCVHRILKQVVQRHLAKKTKEDT